MIARIVAAFVLGAVAYVALHETSTIWTWLEYAAIVLISPALLVCCMGIVAFAGLLVAKSK